MVLWLCDWAVPVGNVKQLWLFVGTYKEVFYNSTNLPGGSEAEAAAAAAAATDVEFDFLM